MFGAPVRQGIDATSPISMPITRKGPLEAAKDTFDLPGSPMASEKSTSELLRAKSALQKQHSRLRRFESLLNQVERECQKDEDTAKQQQRKRSSPTRSMDPFTVVPFNDAKPTAASFVPATLSATTTKTRTDESPVKRVMEVVRAWEGEIIPAPEQFAAAPASALPPHMQQQQQHQQRLMTPTKRTVVVVAPQTPSSPDAPAMDIIPAPTPFRGNNLKDVTNGNGRSDDDSAIGVKAASGMRRPSASAAPRAITRDTRKQGVSDSRESLSSAGSSTCSESIHTDDDSASVYELYAGASMRFFGTTQTDRNVLQMACARGNLERVAALLRQGHDINTSDEEGRTPLMYAVHCNQPECVRFLINQGANLNQQSKDGSTALHYAAFCGTEAMVLLLVDAGADHLVRDVEGRNPIHWAAHNPIIGCLSVLIKRCIPSGINIPDAAGMTPAMWSAYYDRPNHLAKLERNAADLSMRDVEGKHLIHWCAHGPGTACLKMVLTRETSELRDSMGKTPAHYAAEHGNRKGLKAILAIRPDAARDVDDNGRTVLHWAAVCGHAQVVHQLLRAGADASATDAHGYTALEYATMKESQSVIAALTAEMSRQNDQARPFTALSADLIDDEESGLPSDAVRHIFALLTRGSYLEKYTNKGKGASHERYFWVDMNTGELCWTKSPEEFAKNPSSVSAVQVLNVFASASEALTSRRDFEPKGKHRFAFTVQTEDRLLDLVAPNEEQFRLWVEGLRCILVYGSHLIQNSTTNVLNLSNMSLVTEEIDV